MTWKINNVQKKKLPHKQCEKWEPQLQKWALQWCRNKNSLVTHVIAESVHGRPAWSRISSSLNHQPSAYMLGATHSNLATGAVFPWVGKIPTPYPHLPHPHSKTHSCTCGQPYKAVTKESRSSGSCVLWAVSTSASSSSQHVLIVKSKGWPCYMRTFRSWRASISSGRCSSSCLYSLLPEENTCWQGTRELKLPNMGKWNHLACLQWPYPPSTLQGPQCSLMCQWP